MTTMYLIKTNKPNLFQRIDEEAITLYGLTPCVKKGLTSYVKNTVLPNRLLSTEIATSIAEWNKYFNQKLHRLDGQNVPNQPQYLSDLHLTFFDRQDKHYVITDLCINIQTTIDRAKKYGLDIQIVDDIPETFIYDEYMPVNLDIVNRTFSIIKTHRPISHCNVIKYKFDYAHAVNNPYSYLDKDDRTKMIDSELFKRITTALIDCGFHVENYYYCVYKDYMEVPESEKEQIIHKMKEKYNINLTIHHFERHKD